MATTILTGRALKTYLDQQAESGPPAADAFTAEPFPATTPDPEDALAEFVYPGAHDTDSPVNTVVIVWAEVMAALEAVERQPRAGA